ncbi:short chain dehydrogenase [Paenibacillus sambharensis]|uniref:Short chain dehydrogenase n=1 Tax=Paenibacillus sambharensis TaxID=1803190 RepID=A0A2W1LF90_9BACL|nr:short chain dehydrogenase [Paenibacillus sambharensis]PZD96710.1 short chain dehydrogenase [Paenibacillus sambharensis]
MKVLLIGATGTIGSAVYRLISPRHEVMTAGRSEGDVRVDITSTDSITAMYESVGKVDAVISTPGASFFGPLAELTPERNEIAIESKLKGQINIVLLGIPYMRERGSFTLTTGITMDDPVKGGASAAMACGAVSAFVKAASLDMPDGIRINHVSPGLLEESKDKYSAFFPGFEPVPGTRVAQAYLKSLEGAQTGQTYRVY